MWLGAIDDDDRQQAVASMIRVHPPRAVPHTARRRTDLSPDLDALADRVHRLRPSHRDPEHFHVEKDEIARELRRLARGQGVG